MRITTPLLIVCLACGCTGFVVGGGSSHAGRPAAVTTTDATITVHVRNQLDAVPRLKASKIGVRTVSGTVTLTGTVDNYAEREQAGRLAKATRGVTAVTNRLTVNRN